METDYEVGLDGLIDQFRACPNFRRPIKKLWVGKVLGLVFRDRFKRGADQGHRGSEFLKHWLEELGCFQRHRSFADGDVSPFMLAFFDFGVVSADVPRVDCNDQPIQWKGPVFGEVGQGFPIKDRARDGFILAGKVQLIVADEGVVLRFVYIDPAPPGIIFGVNRLQAVEEGFTGDGVLKSIKVRPIRLEAQRGEDRLGLWKTGWCGCFRRSILKG